MMTTVICTKCGEPSVITSRSVTLPFVCNRHSEVTDAPLYSTPEEMDENLGIERDTMTEPTQDGISEAMLLDMAAQLKDARQELTAALDSKEFCNGLLNEALKQGEELAEKNKALAKQAETLGIEKFKLSQRVANSIGVIMELLEAVRVRNRAGQMVCEELQDAETTLAAAKQAVANMQYERDAARVEARQRKYTAETHQRISNYYQRETISLRDDVYRLKQKIEKLKSRGLWQRIWQTE